MYHFEAGDLENQNTLFEMMYNMFIFHEFDIFSNSQNGINFNNFEKIAHKIAKSKYFVDIWNESDSPINYLSDDI